MNYYFLRCAQSDIPNLHQLGALLGVLQCIERPFIIPATESTDEIHGVETDWIAVPGCLWDVIEGGIPQPLPANAPPDAVPEMKKDDEGNLLFHANVTTPFSLLERAQQLATNHPDLAQALSTIGRYFVVDADGKAVAPSQPYRIFAGWTPPNDQPSSVPVEGVL